MAQMSRNDSFGLVCLTTAAHAHPAIVMSHLICKIIVSHNKKIHRIQRYAPIIGSNESF